MQHCKAIRHHDLQADQMLPPATRSLPHLRILKLVGMDLQEFPASVASCLEQLTSLDLSENLLTCLPAAVALITTLQALDMSSNCTSLKKSDVDLLGALPNLRTLDFLKNYRGQWDNPGLHIYNLARQNERVIKAIKKSLPHLDLPGLM